MPASSITKAKKGVCTILKDGYIVDGTGKKGKTGSVLLNGPMIEKIAYGKLAAKGTVIDCRGKIIAPGFIDAHSHLDWFLPAKKRPEFTMPFLAQGITTFVAGNCGFSFAGIKKDAQPGHMNLFLENLFKEGIDGMHWRTMKEYFAYLRKNGITHNTAMLTGHGAARTSMRGFDPSPLSPDEMEEMIAILEDSLDAGARGISIGLQYEPGIFATQDEMRRMMLLARRKDALFTAHLRAYSALSAEYPIRPFGTPHNIKALQDILELARETGVSLQVSHLIFVGERTWKSAERALTLIDRAIADGVDVKFDTYAAHCGASIINVLLPAWFLADVPANFSSTRARRKLAVEFFAMEKLLGFSTKDIQITNANHEELNRYNGMFLNDIARERGLSIVDNFLDFAQKSKGVARVLMHRYSNPEIVGMLMKHPASFFMTDAWIEVSGFQNPSAFGCFPRFLQLARDRGYITLDEAVHKMTGAAAERMKLRDRGYIREKLAADIVVFDWDKIRDNTSVEKTDAAPSGIEYVFMNGVPVMEKGKIDSAARAGMVLD